MPTDLSCLCGGESITMQYPFKFEGEAVDKIRLRLPNYKESKHSRTLNENEILDYFLTTLSEQEPDLIDAMDPADIITADNVVMGFLGIAES